MSQTERRLQDLGIVLPQPLQLPPGVVFPFSWVRIVGTRALISGRGPVNLDGTIAQPLLNFIRMTPNKHMQRSPQSEFRILHTSAVRAPGDAYRYAEEACRSLWKPMSR
ncbi:hypothetical protein [Leptolyngbya sp. FACHB-261]|uniref:hypothetical protein n=1 Tax=Leptolyngbya sp. FACHB-261 TaxID=2692806 RepID=UPI001688FEBC|nr:hypothetical protein [Leptolyngbya sp. FACHB-261]